MISSLLAGIFRSVNARLLHFDHPLLHRLLKLVYGISAFFYRSGWGRKPGSMVIDNFDGDLKLRIDPSRNMGASVYWTGFHEYHELLFLHHFLKPEMVVLDAGANVGMFTVFMARRVSGGKVIAFEPVPSMHDRLLDNIALNGFSNVMTRAAGLSDQTGTLPIHEIDSTHEGLSTLYPGDLKTLWRTDVPVVPLDSVFTEFGVQRFDLIKIDIEGGELPALRGMRGLIAQHHPAVVAEINSATYASAGYTPADVYTFFHELGYRPFEITRTGGLRPSMGEATFNNIVFLHQ